MKSILKTLLLIVWMVCLSSPAVSLAVLTDPTGQTQASNPQATEWLNYLTQELSLDTEQQKQIEPTLIAAANSLQTIKAQGTSGKTPDQIIDDVNHVIELTLKPEQKTKFAQISESWKARLKS